MDKSCAIVRDLLPLYAEEMLSEETKEYVDEHLETCELCRAELTRLREAETVLPRSGAVGEELLPLKQVKRKLSKKRIVTICVTVLLTLAALSLYIATRPMSVDYGESEIHSIEEINAAMATVRLHFVQMRGCKLFSLSYAGDERSAAELAYANKNGAAGYVDCIVLNSVFRSPFMGGGAWEANELYTWSWTVAKTNAGVWALINYGYA